MAYLTHEAYRSHATSAGYAARVRRMIWPAAGVAAALAVAAFALSGETARVGAPESAVAAKGDRLASAAPAGRNDDVTFRRDEAARTTIVARGATVPLATDSADDRRKN